EILVAALDSMAGDNGLFLAKILLAQFLVLSAAFIFAKLSRDWFFGLFLGVVAAVACQNHFTLRPQTFTWVYLLGAIFFADRAIRRNRLFPDGFLLCGIFALWANAHITTVIGVTTIIAWTYRRDRLALCSGLVLCAVIGTLLTPYLGGEWLTFLSKTSHPFEYSDIAEFQPANILQFPTGFLILALSLCGLLIGFQPRLVFESPLLPVFGLGVVLGSLGIVKFLPYATLITLSWAARLWSEREAPGTSFGTLEMALGHLQSVFYRFPLDGLGFVLVCLNLVLGAQLYQGERVDSGIVPVEAVKLLHEKNLPKPWLHTFGHGGYLMYDYTSHSADPSEYVFIDGRTNVTPPDIAKIFGEARSGSRSWRRVLEISNPNSILWVGASPFVSLLLLTKEWCIVREFPGPLRHTVLVKREEIERRPEEFEGAVCE
ncbi:MAG: hypothetical protein KDD60_11095, partial [Bdellovibrionales bacterium]|nr:hypothetical protein [Bdellovibrionales bacterium]